MITYHQGNLLEANVEALVNTVNTVGVMGSGIALMFKERYPANFRAYVAACKTGDVRIGRMFVTETGELYGPRWIINFPTKEHWRHPSRLKWIEDGLRDLVRVVREHNIRSIALPPLGCGNGGLDWRDVRPLIAQALALIPDVEAVVFEPTPEYQNVTKRQGVHELTIARALIAESIRRYWFVGVGCTILEIHKLAWFLTRALERRGLPDILDLRFQANRYGPFSPRLNHLLNTLDGSYLRSGKRLPDCGPQDNIAFVDNQTDVVAAFLQKSEARIYQPVIQDVDNLIDGFQSPLGMELLATVDWLLTRRHCAPDVAALRKALQDWPGGAQAARRKLRLFPDRYLELALQRLTAWETAKGVMDGQPENKGI